MKPRGPFAEQLETNAPMIAFNGAMACDWRTGMPLFTTDIPVEIARGVCAMAEERGVFIQYFPNGGSIIKNASPPSATNTRGACAITGRKPFCRFRSGSRARP